MGYISKNRHKFYLKCHLIFVYKYRNNYLFPILENVCFPHLKKLNLSVILKLR